MIRYCLFVFALVFSILPSSVHATDTVEKTDCKLAIGYDSMDDLKSDLLLSAKRLAVNELFGELITAATSVDDFVVTSDQIRASSLGLVRVEGTAEYHHGDSLGEVCVTIQVYTTEQDREKFEPQRLSKRQCVTDSDLSTRELTSFAKEEVIVQALLDYDQKLRSIDRGKLLRLLQRVTYQDSGFIPETETYCVRIDGYIIPIEIITLLEDVDVEPAVALPDPTGVPEPAQSDWEVVFNDNFDDGDAQGWIRDRPHNWSVENGEFVLTIPDKNQKAQASIPINLVTDYAIEFRVKNTSCVDNGVNVLGLYDLDLRHGHEYGAPNVTLNSGVNLENKYYLLERDIWYKVKVEVIKQNVFVYIDDNLLFTYLDNRLPSPSDAVGLFGWTGACNAIKTHFDDVVVSIKPSATTD